MKRFIIPLIVSLLILSAWTVYAALPPALIERMAGSDQNVAYRGTQMAEEHHGPRLISTTRRVWYDRGLSRVESVDSRTGLEWVSIDDGQFNRHFVPRTAMYFQTPSRLRQELDRREQMLRNLLSSAEVQEDTEFVLGRPCTVVRTRTAPFETTLWVDQRTGLPLRVERSTPRGMMSRLAFTEIAFLPSVAPEVFRMPEMNRWTVYEDFDLFERDLRLLALSRDAGTTVMIPRGMPRQHRLVETEVVSAGNARLLHLQFRGQGQVMSLFQSVQPDDSPDFQVNVLTRLKLRKGTEIVEWRSEGRRFLLIANLPAPYLQQIAQTTLLKFIWR